MKLEENNGIENYFHSVMYNRQYRGLLFLSFNDTELLNNSTFVSRFWCCFFSVYHLSEVALSSGLVTVHINGEIAVSECLNLSSGQMFHGGSQE